MASENAHQLGYVGRYRLVQLKGAKVVVGAANEDPELAEAEPIHPVKRVHLSTEHIRKIIVALDRFYDLAVVPERYFNELIGFAGVNRRLRFVGNEFQGKYYLQIRVYYQPRGVEEDQPGSEGVSFERPYFGAALRLIVEFYRRLTFPRDADASAKLLEEVQTIEKLTPATGDITDGPVPKSLEEVRALLIARMDGEPGRRIGPMLYREYFRHMLTVCYGRLIQYRFERLAGEDLFRL